MHGKLSDAFEEIDSILVRIENKFKNSNKLRGSIIKESIRSEIGEPLKIILDNNKIVSDELEDDIYYEFIGTSSGELEFYFFGGLCDVNIALFRFKTLDEYE